MSGATRVYSFAPAPVQSPMVDDRGYVTIPWVQWITQSLGPRVDNSLQTVTLNGDLSGTGGATLTPLVLGIQGHVLPALPGTPANLRWSGAAWIYDATAYAHDDQVVHLAGAEAITGSKTFTQTISCQAINAQGAVNTTANYQVNGVQVLAAQQTGLGAQLAAYTLTGTYATDLPKLQLLFNKVVALETALRAHGMVTT